MNSFGLKKIVAADYHRNGISGYGFTVSIVEAKERKRYLVIRLDDDARKALGQVPCFVVDLDMAAAGNIAFGQNSWRGDCFADEMDRLEKPAHAWVNGGGFGLPATPEAAAIFGTKEHGDA